MGNLQTFAIAGVCLAALLAALIGYNAYENAQIRSDAKATAERDSIVATENTVNNTLSKAEAARVLRRYCPTVNKDYDFSTGKCVERVSP